MNYYLLMMQIVAYFGLIRILSATVPVCRHKSLKEERDIKEQLKNNCHIRSQENVKALNSNLEGEVAKLLQRGNMEIGLSFCHYQLKMINRHRETGGCIQAAQMVINFLVSATRVSVVAISTNGFVKTDFTNSEP